jgi:UDP-N-acetylmuramate dehydrogenase
VTFRIIGRGNQSGGSGRVRPGAGALKLCGVPDEMTGRLADYTTLRLGGPARRLVEADSAAEIIAEVRRADAAGTPLLLVAGGSNLVIGDDGFDGTAVLLRSRGIDVRDDGDDVLVRVEAGESWDALVARAVDEGWSGIECLSGIPGSTGATPIQNVGAYGQDIAETFHHATVYDRESGRTRPFSAGDCGFSYRNSVFKHNNRYVVLDVTYRLRKDRRSAPIRYAETARRLGVAAGETVPLETARRTVLELRRGKGMVLDPGDHDTYSAGSFFINPVVTATAFEELCATLGDTPPHWPEGEDIKLSAAWLIGRAGFDKGYGRYKVAISGKHTLALTNRGGGTTTALLALAAEVRQGVAAAFGVTLHPEPVLVNARI